MLQKKRRTSSLKFALSTKTHELPKYSIDSEGNVIDPNFNNRTYVKKAYQAYLKGKRFFNYKDDIYPIPLIDPNYIYEEE